MASPVHTKMQYTRLGNTGLKVSRIILGCMSYGSKRWEPWVFEEAESIALLKSAYDRGINTWDTADVYSNGVSETIVAKAIKEYGIPREKLVIMNDKVLLSP
jgi:aryl-alcohol dehydrogenase-like predicted oxidoreductase